MVSNQKISENSGIAEAPLVGESPIILSPTSENLSSLFGSTSPQKEEINILSSVPEVSVAPEVSTVAVEAKMIHTNDFIRESIAKIDSMICIMDEAHAKKLEEAQGYKTEKEHYAELEGRAYIEAEKTIEEKSQAKKMKTYLEKELKHIEYASEEVD